MRHCLGLFALTCVSLILILVLPVDAKKLKELTDAQRQERSFKYHNKAAKLAGTGDLEGAFGLLKKAKVLTPDNHELCGHLGHVAHTLATHYSAGGDWDRAQPFWDALEPHNATAWLLDRARFKKVQSVCEQWIKEEKKLSSAQWEHYGVALGKLGRTGEAYECFQKALKFATKPEDMSRVNGWMAISSFLSQKFEQTEKHLRSMPELSSSVDLQSRLASCLMKQEKLAESREALQNSFKLAGVPLKPPMAIGGALGEAIAAGESKVSLTGEDDGPVATFEVLSKPQETNDPFAKPTIIVIDDFLSSVEADALLDAHTQTYEGDRVEPYVCFMNSSTIHSLEDQNAFKYADESVLFFHTAETPCFNITDELRNQLSWSKSTLIFPGELKASDVVDKRVELLMGLPTSHAASGQLLSYNANSEYNTHTDCSMFVTGNQRAYTVLMYLSDVSEGGATTFPRLDISVKPKKGRALIFSNLDEQGICNVLTEHKGEKTAVASEKFVYNKWYHQYMHVTPPSKEELFATRPVQPRQSFVNCDDNVAQCREYAVYGH